MASPTSNTPISSGVLALAVSENTQKPMVFAAGEDGEIRVMRDDGEIRKSFLGHTGAVRAIAIGDGGDLIVTGSSDRTARLWTESGEQLGVLEHENAVSVVATWPNGDARCVTGIEDGAIVI